MSGRIPYAEFGKTAAAARNALAALSKSAEDLGLDKTISELVKLRVSQINGCAFCVAYHLKILRALKVEQDRLDLVAAWRESPNFSDTERAALAWAEEMTRIAERPPNQAAYEELKAHFTQNQIIGLNISIASIQAWNRLGVGFGFSPADV